MKRILIVGDSFCSPSLDSNAWTNQLSHDYNVINLGQNGIGQYKIHQQLTSVSLTDFDHVVMLITSPFRIHVETNPFYAKDHTSHPNCDLIYEDVLNKSPSPERDMIAWWFEKMFDLEQAKFVQESIVMRDIDYINRSMRTVTPITFFPKLGIPQVHDFSDIWKSCPGKVNHLSTEGHKQVVNRLTQIFQLTLSK